MKKKMIENKEEEKIFYTISEVSRSFDEPQYTLRYWEAFFPQLKPMQSCGRRYYRQSDIDIISKIRALLREELYTIEGARRQLGKT